MVSNHCPSRQTSRGTEIRTLTDRVSKNLELAKVRRVEQSGVSKWTLATAVDTLQVLKGNELRAKPNSAHFDVLVDSAASKPLIATRALQAARTHNVRRL